MVKYLKTAQMSCTEKTNGGILYLLPDLFIKLYTLALQVALWKVVMAFGAQVDLTLSQMLTYVYVSALLSKLLVVETAATGWLSEGVLMRYYSKPLSVLGQLAAQTVGGWLPELLLFSLPMALLAPLFGIGLTPASLLFVPSLALCVLLGFAIDFLFACLSIKMRNMSWLIGRIRAAVAALLSGTVIPIRLLPPEIAGILKYQPFACLGGAPLSILVGVPDSMEIFRLQLLWNLILWPVALIVFKKSQEGIVSYGG